MSQSGVPSSSATVATEVVGNVVMPTAPQLEALRTGLNQLLISIVKNGGSDIHFKVESPVVARIHGDLKPIQGKKLGPEDLNMLAVLLLPESRKRDYSIITEFDTAYSIKDFGRFRVNIYRQRGQLSFAFRHIPHDIPTLEKLRVPAIAAQIAMEHRGLVLVTGITGSGKSSTLAAMIRHINENRNAHVITIEDPIEFVHNDINCIIQQREVGVDTPGFVVALRAAMREDPDIILVGEMRDAETIETAIRAAETGHLVMSTLHTLDARETINRILDTFEGAQQKQIRIQLASVLKAVFSQRLIPLASGKGRVLAADVLIATATIRGCIEDPEKFNDILDHQRAGRDQYGMQTFDQSLMEHYKAGLITLEEALNNATSPADFERALTFK